MKNRIAGLHLWDVATVHSSYWGGARNMHTTLLITTASPSVEIASRKATRFLKSNPDEFPNTQIVTISHRGTLDA